MNQKILYILLGVSLGLNVSLCGAMAYWLTRPEKVPGAPVWERPFAHLPASLKTKLRPVRRQDIAEFRKIGEDLAEAHGSLYTELREDPPDNKRIQDEMNKITQLQAKIQTLVVQRILDESKQLTPEEREIYFQTLGSRLLPFKGRPGLGPPGPWPWHPPRHGSGGGMGIGRQMP